MGAFSHIKLSDQLNISLIEVACARLACIL